jgi:ATP phosphoribosyltransferase
MPTNPERVTIALPSKGALADPTLDFLKACDLKIAKPNPRQYVATMPTLPSVDVLFQRVTDIVYKVADGTVDMGVTGLDVVRELAGDEVIVMHPNLGYGDCDLVAAVPEAWIDVETMTDLADVALDFRSPRSSPIWRGAFCASTGYTISRWSRPKARLKPRRRWATRISSSI